MATILLSAAGAALGGSLGGTLLGLPLAVVGRAAGAVAGRLIDERLLGRGSAATQSGRIDRFRVMGASPGAPVGQVFGRMRVAGQVIWASQFLEAQSGGGGGKGGAQREPVEFSYSVSLAVALCEGEITRLGRIWADGEEIAQDDLTLRLYPGSEAQLPDPKITATEGTAPGYRGTAYVVFEDLALGPFGNRVPQFSFEVFRPGPEGEGEDIARIVPAVALIPGTGEYALATSPVYLSGEFGEQKPVNLNTITGGSDFTVSLDALDEELPLCGAVSLVVSWFGDDLRAGSCLIKPKVEQGDTDAPVMPWRSGGITRSGAEIVPKEGGRSVYGGTPCDQSVIEAIAALKAKGKEVMYYPFILMDQMPGNVLPDPYDGGAPGQPPLPWRGRITTALAPGQAGTTDGTGAAAAEVAAFFGTAQPSDFSVNDTLVNYTGPAEWSFRRFILHQAHLCAAAGGVDAFCIGSEMVALTSIRGAGNSFPAVTALMALAADVRAILGAGVQLTYAADWSEYHGYQPAGTADKFFHLDPLWADSNVDFIGIDNYMPLSDWREGETHADAGAGSIYDLDYLSANVAGGELYDWYYPSDEARDGQIRAPITDAGENEPWVWRVKDIKGWWEHLHHDRIGGVRQTAPTAWTPRSKPVRFTELGCAAVDKGTNQPNKFVDPKSSESALPYYSTGRRDEYIQLQYLRAHAAHWADRANNPVSPDYGAPMLDWPRTHVWAYDARPFPAFPARDDLWGDGDNYARGHWLNGRTTSRPLSSVVREICARSGVSEVETRRLHGLLRGYRMEDEASARAALQVLMLAYGFDVAERDGALSFISRTGLGATALDEGALVMDPEAEASLTAERAAQAERVGRVRLSFVEAEAGYEAAAAEAVFADDPSLLVSSSELPLALTRGEARALAERWLAEARLARESLTFALPPSRVDLGPGDIVSLKGRSWRLDRLEDVGFVRAEAVRIEPETYRVQEAEDEVPAAAAPVAPVPVAALFLDLPLISGDENPAAPHVAMVARPWPGDVALHAADDGVSFGPAEIFPRASVAGTLLSPLAAARPGLYDRGAALTVKLVKGALASVTEEALLAGSNLAAIGAASGGGWEVFQFRDAVLNGDATWEVSMRLRGQLGSEGEIMGPWPAGSFFVLLDGVPKQIELAANQRNLTRLYRWGPASRPLADASYREADLAFAGIGLRPYAPVALTGAYRADGGTDISWIRRTRSEGDAWEPEEVPLGEVREAYRLRIKLGGTLVRKLDVTAPGWRYSAAAKAADGTAAGYRAEVAQLSDRFGPGAFAKADLI